ncbi:hypothetical protein HY634_03705 [Candidatus Uhrbacteria bacterium]|nr:hypothetical protein [Candidatus Uhrbacteria bacterium]
MVLTILLVNLVIVLATIVILGTFAYGALRGAPWVPTRARDIQRAVALAGMPRGAVVGDVGCGDGSVLAAFVATGCRVRGWELAIVPWLRARWRFRHDPDARIQFGDFWHTNLSSCDLIYAYLLPETHAKLAKKLRRELHPGTRIIASVWPFPDWEPVAVDRLEGHVPLYLYEI